jgi:hypothetical protein
MEKETSISKGVIKSFNKKAEEINDKYSLSLQLAEIFGSRWSYVAGDINKEEINLPPVKIRINDNLGLIIYGLIEDESVIDEIKEEILEVLK